ncbi:tRNA-specific adenosine deaminase 1 [Halotydeus destructor]|nr:tRNA-specific adenosine deaminase 1 [Halotydeus destructor]
MTPSDAVTCTIYLITISLDKAGKPLETEWTTLAAIVQQGLTESCEPRNLEVVALATGTKCVTGKDARLPNVIADCHAESLLKRTFKRYLISLLGSSTGSTPLAVDSQHKLHLFVSQLPCGTIERYKGSNCESDLDIVRRKPGRGSRCLKPSCIDKLAKWVRFGLQGKSLIAYTRVPVRIHSLVIGNCVEQQEFDRQRLLAALGIVEPVAEHQQSAKKPRLEIEQFEPPMDFSINFCETFKKDCLTKSDTRQACSNAIVAWKVDCNKSNYHKEVVVLGRRQGQTRKSNNSLLVSSRLIHEATSELTSVKRDDDYSINYGDKWSQLLLTKRFRGWHMVEESKDEVT